MVMRTAQSPFHFKTVFSLVKLTGRQAATLEELCHICESCEEASIFYHTFRAFGSHHYMRGHYNDIAQWVQSELGLEALSEELNNIDVRSFASLREIGLQIAGIIRGHLERQPGLASRTATRPFYLASVVSVDMPVPYIASNLLDFRDMIGKVSSHSIYFHFVESKLRVGPYSNDFSLWIDEQLGLPELAARINGIDVAVNTLEDVREAIIRHIEEHLSRQAGKQKAGPA
jgi:hypothetical protein